MAKKKKPAVHPLVLYIEAHTPGESREVEYKAKTLGEAVEFCLDHAKRHRGVKMRVAVAVPQAGGFYERSHTLFECSFPAIDGWQADEIKNYFGELPT